MASTIIPRAPLPLSGFIRAVGNGQIAHQLTHIDRLFAALGALDDLDHGAAEQIAHIVGKALGRTILKTPCDAVLRPFN